MICGSEIAAVMYDPELWSPEEREPYDDRYTLWLDKTGRTPLEGRRKRTRDQRRGQLFEPTVMDLWREEPEQAGIRFTRSGLWQSTSDPLAGVTPDYICHGCAYGRYGIVDIKTQRHRGEWGTEWEPEIPTVYQFSGVWGQGVLDADHQHFVVDWGWDLFERLLYPHPDLFKFLLQRAHEFWDAHVVTGIAPEATRKASEELGWRWPSPPLGKIHTLTDEEARLLMHAAAHARSAARHERRKDDILAALQAKVGDATEIHWPPDWLGVRNPAATWKPSRVIDGADADWRKENPELSARYATVRTETAVDTARLVAEEGKLPSGLRYRRTWSWTRLLKKGPKQ